MKWILIILAALIGLVLLSVVAVSVLDALGEEMPEERGALVDPVTSERRAAA